MLLSELVNQKIYVGKRERGICRGVGISGKNYTVKYLLCAEKVGTADFSSDFCVRATSIEGVEQSPLEGIFLSRLRPVYPQNCLKLFLSQPIYTAEGAFLGNMQDAELQNFTLTRIFTDRDTAYSALSIAACSDALILRKEQPFPIGQRIPAPVVSIISDKKEGVLTKPLLRSAMQKGVLIRLTLSLPPFDCEWLDFPKPKRHFFF